jgi:hypothetical protein
MVRAKAILPLGRDRTDMNFRRTLTGNSLSVLSVPGLPTLHLCGISLQHPRNEVLLVKLGVSGKVYRL